MNELVTIDGENPQKKGVSGKEKRGRKKYEKIGTYALNKEVTQTKRVT